MVANRVDKQPDHHFLGTIEALENDVNELKSGSQFTEAKMYDYSSANTYDLTGSLSSSTGSYQLLAQLVVTATSVDGVGFISSMVPKLWIPDMSTPYRDTLISDYQILYGPIVTDNITTTKYWFEISARNAVSASTFYFKALIYGTAPITVTFARTV